MIWLYDTVVEGDVMRSDGNTLRSSYLKCKCKIK